MGIVRIGSVRSIQRIKIPAEGSGQVRLATSGNVPVESGMMLVSRPTLVEKGIIIDSMMIPTGGDGKMVAMIRNNGTREVCIEKGQRVGQSVLMSLPMAFPMANRKRLQET